MDQNQNTPKVWNAQKTSAGQGLVAEESTGRNVSVSYNAKDALLIAAAPELLDALESLESVASWTAHNNPRLAEEIVRARAVIAKAKGE